MFHRVREFDFYFTEALGTWEVGLIVWMGPNEGEVEVEAVFWPTTEAQLRTGLVLAREEAAD